MSVRARLPNKLSHTTYNIVKHYDAAFTINVWEYRSISRYLLTALSHKVFLQNILALSHRRIISIRLLFFGKDKIK